MFKLKISSFRNKRAGVTVVDSDESYKKELLLDALKRRGDVPESLTENDVVMNDYNEFTVDGKIYTLYDAGEEERAAIDRVMEDIKTGVDGTVGSEFVESFYNDKKILPILQQEIRDYLDIAYTDEQLDLMREYNLLGENEEPKSDDEWFDLRYELADKMFEYYKHNPWDWFDYVYGPEYLDVMIDKGILDIGAIAEDFVDSNGAAYLLSIDNDEISLGSYEYFAYLTDSKKTASRRSFRNKRAFKRYAKTFPDVSDYLKELKDSVYNQREVKTTYNKSSDSGSFTWRSHVDTHGIDKDFVLEVILKNGNAMVTLDNEMIDKFKYIDGSGDWSIRIDTYEFMKRYEKSIISNNII